MVGLVLLSAFGGLVLMIGVCDDNTWALLGGATVIAIALVIGGLMVRCGG